MSNAMKKPLTTKTIEMMGQQIKGWKISRGSTKCDARSSKKF